MHKTIKERLIGHRITHRLLGIGNIIHVDHELYIKVRFEQEYDGKTVREFNLEAFEDGVFGDLESDHLILELIREKERIEKERIKSKTLQKKLGKLIRIVKSHFTQKFLSAHISLPNLNIHDLRLALQWISDLTNLPSEKNYDELKKILIERYPKDWNIGRVLSARAAEKATKFYYEQKGYDVEDLSIKQIDKTNLNLDWVDYDFMVKGLYPIDVKNSRRSQNSPDRYVEHCVPQFKHSKRSKQDVVIVGTLSPYLWVQDLIEPTKTNYDTSIIFLGETTAERQLLLKEAFEDPNLLLIHFHRPLENQKKFFPPWIFDYPSFCYRERDEIFRQFREVIIADTQLNEIDTTGVMPILLSAEIDPKLFTNFQMLEGWEKTFCKQLHSNIKKFGLSLPFLFMTILKHFIFIISNPIQKYEPEDYRKFIFYENFKDKPLALYDPLLTINELIESLTILWETKHELILSFKIFRLQGLNIFQGKSHPNETLWKNLIAYCGGRLKDGSKCGRNPLVLGRSNLCGECGKLICPDCLFCSQNCKANYERKR